VTQGPPAEPETVNIVPIDQLVAQPPPPLAYNPAPHLPPPPFQHENPVLIQHAPHVPVMVDPFFPAEQNAMMTSGLPGISMQPPFMPIAGMPVEQHFGPVNNIPPGLILTPQPVVDPYLPGYSYQLPDAHDNSQLANFEGLPMNNATPAAMPEQSILGLPPGTVNLPSEIKSATVQQNQTGTLKKIVPWGEQSTSSLMQRLDSSLKVLKQLPKGSDENKRINKIVKSITYYLKKRKNEKGELNGPYDQISTSDLINQFEKLTAQRKQFSDKSAEAEFNNIGCKINQIKSHLKTRNLPFTGVCMEADEIQPDLKKVRKKSVNCVGKSIEELYAMLEELEDLKKSYPSGSKGFTEVCLDINKIKINIRKEEQNKLKTNIVEPNQALKGKGLLKSSRSELVSTIIGLANYKKTVHCKSVEFKKACNKIKSIKNHLNLQKKDSYNKYVEELSNLQVRLNCLPADKLESKNLAQRNSHLKFIEDELKKSEKQLSIRDVAIDIDSNADYTKRSLIVTIIKDVENLEKSTSSDGNAVQNAMYIQHPQEQGRVFCHSFYLLTEIDSYT